MSSPRPGHGGPPVADGVVCLPVLDAARASAGKRGVGRLS